MEQGHRGLATKFSFLLMCLSLPLNTRFRQPFMRLTLSRYSFYTVEYPLSDRRNQSREPLLNLSRDNALQPRLRRGPLLLDYGGTFRLQGTHCA